MLAMVQVDYTLGRQIQDMRPDKREILRAKVPSLRIPEGEDLETGWYYGIGDVMLSFEDIGFMTMMDLTPPIKRINSMQGYSGGGEATRNKLESVVQVHISNVALLELAAVEVLEDYCTDALQGFLDEGWRIIAICPPVGTRRPTYIVGHKERSQRGKR